MSEEKFKLMGEISQVSGNLIVDEVAKKTVGFINSLIDDLIPHDWYGVAGSGYVLFLEWNFNTKLTVLIGRDERDFWIYGDNESGEFSFNQEGVPDKLLNLIKNGKL